MLSSTNENKSQRVKTGSQVSATTTLWQHPYVDVFKHFKITPVCDWKQNKKLGDVSEIFVSPIIQIIKSL